LITQADKVFLTLAGGSENILTDAVSYQLTVDDSSVDAAVFSKADLTINGDGALTVNGSCKHGIVSKDDMVITGGTLTVSASSTGIEGKDCVKIIAGSVSVISGADGVRATNTEDAERGFVYIADGTLSNKRRYRRNSG
jgi:hypothetical protein